MCLYLYDVVGVTFQIFDKTIFVALFVCLAFLPAHKMSVRHFITRYTVLFALGNRVAFSFGSLLAKVAEE